MYLPPNFKGPAMKAKKFIDESTFVQARMERLRQSYDVDLGTAFDATDGGYIGKGWLISYAVLNFTVSIPSPPSVIPDDVYGDAIAIFMETHRRLERERTFYTLRLQPSARDSAWSLTLFLSNDQLDTKHADVRQVAELLLRLKASNGDFQSMYSDLPHPLTCLSNRLNQVLAFPLPEPVDFAEHFVLASKLEQAMINDEYSGVLLGMAGMFLGNSCFFAGALEQAIEHWHNPANQGKADAFFNIACAFSRLGEMEEAYTNCKKAIAHNYSIDAILHDPDFAEFRAHPLFQKIRKEL